MGYNKINQYKRYLIIVEIVQKHYVEGISNYKGIWRKHINPTYPMSYSKFIEIINIPNLATKLKEEEERVAAGGGQKNKYLDPNFIPKNQLDLFQVYSINNKNLKKDV